MARNDDDEALEAYEGESVGRAVGRGVAALIGVALVVGLLFGAGAVVLTKMVGLGGDDAGTGANSTAKATLYMPDPETTVTPQATQPAVEETEVVADPVIVLRATPETVSSYGQITLSGTYAQGVGSVLLVERKSGEAWVPFADGDISTVVQPDGSFTTWVKTAQAGENTFRVTDQDKQLSSPGVSVIVG